MVSPGLPFVLVVLSPLNAMGTRHLDGQYVYLRPLADGAAPYAYALAIWNLGTMFDLMADKGVRTSLFYSVIRHPNYTLEAAMFLVLEMVGLSGGVQWLAFLMYFFVYWIRSEREDNFMRFSNPAYEPYAAATPHKFIPGIY